MASPFQQVRDTLDALLEKDKAHLEAEDIGVRDWSYDTTREPLSCWSYAFELRWTVAPFVVKVQVHLTCIEPLPNEEEPTTSVTRLAEVFQIGAIPQIQNRSEEQVALDQLTTEGLGHSVMRELDNARATLPSAYQRGE